MFFKRTRKQIKEHNI